MKPKKERRNIKVGPHGQRYNTQKGKVWKEKDKYDYDRDFLRKEQVQKKRVQTPLSAKDKVSELKKNKPSVSASDYYKEKLKAAKIRKVIPDEPVIDEELFENETNFPVSIRYFSQSEIDEHLQPEIYEIITGWYEGLVGDLDDGVPEDIASGVIKDINDLKSDPDTLHDTLYDTFWNYYDGWFSPEDSSESIGNALSVIEEIEELIKTKTRTILWNGEYNFKTYSDYPDSNMPQEIHNKIIPLIDHNKENDREDRYEELVNYHLIEMALEDGILYISDENNKLSDTEIYKLKTRGIDIIFEPFEELEDQVSVKGVKYVINNYGLTKYTAKFRDWILENAVNKQWFAEALTEEGIKLRGDPVKQYYEHFGDNDFMFTIANHPDFINYEKILQELKK